jgi:hypothetical protein
VQGNVWARGHFAFISDLFAFFQIRAGLTSKPAEMTPPKLRCFASPEVQGEWAIGEAL